MLVMALVSVTVCLLRRLSFCYRYHHYVTLNSRERDGHSAAYWSDGGISLHYHNCDMTITICGCVNIYLWIRFLSKYSHGVSKDRHCTWNVYISFKTNQDLKIICAVVLISCLNEHIHVKWENWPHTQRKTLKWISMSAFLLCHSTLRTLQSQ